MASAASTTARNGATTGASSAITHVSVHTSAAAFGFNEAAGGTPAYARKAVTFGAVGAVGPMGASDQPATPGVRWSGQMTFDVPSGSYLSWGSWDAATGGNFQVGADFAVGFSPTAQATLTFAIGIRTQPGG